MIYTKLNSLFRQSALLLLSFVIIAATSQNIVNAKNYDVSVRVIIGFNSAPGLREERLIAQSGGSASHTFSLVPAIAATVPQASISGLMNNPLVSYIEEDGTLSASDIELDNTWGVKHIGAGEVHDTNVTGSGVKVAVIDSGIDYTHPDLAANYAGGYDFVNEDNDPMDDYGHGTHVSGTIGAADNEIGVVGVSPNVQLYALKVLSSENQAFWSDVVRAVEWSVDNGMQITNTSLGGDRGSTTMKNAYANAYEQGLIHFTSAGNKGTCNVGKKSTVNYPAKYSSLIAVAAVDSSDSRTCFSSTGNEVELSAPGLSVNSTLWGGGYGVKNGTSMASPHAAGAAALLIEAGIVDSDGNGKINDNIRAILADTAVDLGSTGFDTHYGYGRVDVFAAVEALLGGPTAPQPTEVLIGSVVYSESGGRNRNKNVNVAIATINDLGGAVGGAVVTVDITVDGSIFTSESGTTDGSGNVGFSIRNAPTGCYMVTVTSISATTLSWDGTTLTNEFCKYNATPL